MKKRGRNESAVLREQQKALEMLQWNVCHVLILPAGRGELYRAVVLAKGIWATSHLWNITRHFSHSSENCVWFSLIGVACLLFFGKTTLLQATKLINSTEVINQTERELPVHISHEDEWLQTTSLTIPKNTIKFITTLNKYLSLCWGRGKCHAAACL